MIRPAFIATYAFILETEVQVVSLERRISTKKFHYLHQKFVRNYGKPISLKSALGMTAAEFN
jgi:hypothetical protein